MVDEFSAFVHYSKANPPEPINANHIDMVKFLNEEDNNYDNIQKKLVRMETRITATDQSS